MADASNGKSIYDKPKRKEQTTGEALKTFLWNSETSECCGRTGISWFKITAFYLVFFSCLALFFLAMFSLFWLTMDENKPRWILGESLIGTNPGVGFRPMPDQDKNSESTLIWINTEREDSQVYWAEEMRLFFEKNYINKTSSNKTCTFENGNVTDDKTGPCDIDLASLNVPGFGCNPGNKYGYTGNLGQPCVLVKLNKIYSWEPEALTANDLDAAIERGLPEKLQKRIKELSGKTDKASQRQLNTVWLSCEGENPADRENMGPLEYWAPGFKEQFPGIPNYYFPYEMQPTYKSPFVFIKLIQPRRNVLIQVECKAWAKNIIADRFQRLGSVHFEIMID